MKKLTFVKQNCPYSYHIEIPVKKLKEDSKEVGKNICKLVKENIPKGFKTFKGNP